MIRLRCVPLTQLFSSFKALSRSNDHGDITPLESLMTILASTVGIGNIAGIATAIAIGGPGALFWMNCAAIIGMATAYSEAYLAVKWLPYSFFYSQQMNHRGFLKRVEYDLHVEKSKQPELYLSYLNDYSLLGLHIE